MNAASSSSMDDDADEDVPPPTPSSRRKAGSSGPMFFDDEEEDFLLADVAHGIFPGQSRSGGSQKKNKTEALASPPLTKSVDLSASSAQPESVTSTSRQPLPAHSSFAMQPVGMICDRATSFSGSRRSGRSRYQPLSLALANDYGAEESKTYLLSPGQSAVYARRRAARAALGNFGENMDEQKEKKRMLQESEDYFGGEDESYPDPKLDCADFQLIGEDSPRYGAECKQLDEILIANGEVKSREGRLEILKRLLENDEAFYARIQSGEVCKNLASFLQDGEVVELLVEGMLGMESLCPGGAEEGSQASQTSPAVTGDDLKISHLNLCHRLPALACDLICGPHTLGAFAMKTITESQSLMVKLVHFLRSCVAMAEGGGCERVACQIEFHCMLWSRLCLHCISGSDAQCLAMFLAALHTDTRSFIASAEKLLWLPCVCSAFEQAVQADRENLVTWVRAGLVRMLLSCLDGGQPELDAAGMMAHPSWMRDCRAEASSSLLVALLNPNGKSEALGCFEKEDLLAQVLELSRRHTLQRRYWSLPVLEALMKLEMADPTTDPNNAPPLVVALASRGAQALCHLEPGQDEATCMQQQFIPRGLCALHLLNVFAQIQVMRENHPAGVELEGLLNHVALRTLMLYKQSRNSCMIHLRAVELLVRFAGSRDISPLLTLIRKCDLLGHLSNALGEGCQESSWPSASCSRSHLPLLVKAILTRAREVQQGKRDMANTGQGKELILLLAGSSVWPKVAVLGDRGGSA